VLCAVQNETETCRSDVYVNFSVDLKPSLINSASDGEGLILNISSVWFFLYRNIGNDVVRNKIITKLKLRCVRVTTAAVEK
jgi:hypothetical protein